jgi:type IV pilus assembly protein PilV
MLKMTYSKHSGFSLIEVLIALFILAIGLLGMATLMMSSVQSTQGASMRSAATVAAYDLAERIRANRAQATAYAGNPASATNPACVTTTAGCNNTDLVSSDLFNWNQALQANIPGAEAVIASTGVNGALCLAIFWDEIGAANTSPLTTTICGVLPNNRAFYTMQVTP